jgi:hypothetical protein
MPIESGSVKRHSVERNLGNAGAKESMGTPEWNGIAAKYPSPPVSDSETMVPAVRDLKLTDLRSREIGRAHV